jgi:hypothetical protein
VTHGRTDAQECGGNRLANVNARTCVRGDGGGGGEGGGGDSGSGDLIEEGGSCRGQCVTLTSAVGGGARDGFDGRVDTVAA